MRGKSEGENERGGRGDSRRNAENPLEPGDQRHVELKRGLQGPGDTPAEWNRVTSTIIAAAMEVHSILGPGLLEKLYEEAMVYELTQRGLVVRRQMPIDMRYKGIHLPGQFVDIAVNELVIVELKSLESVPPAHLARLVSYLRSTGFPLGLLINFNVTHLREGIYRRVVSRQAALPDDFHDDSPAPRSSALSAFSSRRVAGGKRADG